jgi:hypothetical protein
VRHREWKSPNRRQHHDIYDSVKTNRRVFHALEELAIHGETLELGAVGHIVDCSLYPAGAPCCAGSRFRDGLNRWDIHGGARGRVVDLNRDFELDKIVDRGTILVRGTRPLAGRQMMRTAGGLTRPGESLVSITHVAA